MISRLALLAVLVLAGLTLSSSGEGARKPARHIVEIRSFEFHPETLVVSPGDTVVWVNRDIVPHTATADDESWGSEDLDTDESWEFEVQGEGLQSYYCVLHPLMTGTLNAR